MSHTIEDVFTDDTREAFQEETLKEALKIAELANDGIIPPAQLVRLGDKLDAELPWFVATAMEELTDD